MISWASIALLILGGIYYCVTAFTCFWDRCQWDAQAPAELVELTAALEDDLYYPKLLYQFQVGGQTVSSATVIHTADARNPYALEPVLRQMATRSWTVFYDSSDPPRCTLEKRFPTKPVVKAVAFFAAALYFRFLARKKRAS